MELIEPLAQFELYAGQRLQQRRPRRHVVRVGVDLDEFQLVGFLPGERIEFVDRFHLVAEQRHPPGAILIVRRENLDGVAAHAERAAIEIAGGALVLQRHQVGEQLALVELRAALDRERHRRIGLDRADAVDAGHRRHDDDVVALEQRPRRRVPHAVDLLVDRGILLDIGVGARDIGFRLVVVVIRHEIFDGVVGKERPELAVELRRQVLFGARMRAGRCVASITLATVKVLPEPVTPSSTWVRSLRFTPSTRSAIAVGWSPLGSKSALMTKRRPPSDLSGRGGRCGVQICVAPSRARNSSRPSRSKCSSACIDAVTPSVIGCGIGAMPLLALRLENVGKLVAVFGRLAGQRPGRIAVAIAERVGQFRIDPGRALWRRSRSAAARPTLG